MFKHLRPILLITIGLALAFASAALTPPLYPWEQAAPTATSTLTATTITPSPAENEEMVPGTTSLILFLGTILVVIIVASIMWHRRDWERN
jgi:hypothetical protein